MTGTAAATGPEWQADGYSTVSLVLSFPDGKCQEAGKLYEDVLGASPVHGPPMMAGDSVMHYAMNICSSTLMLSDAMPGMPEPVPARAYVYVPDVDAVCKKASESGFKVLQEPETMFWGDRMARTRDPYGNEWTLSTVVNKNVSAEDMKKGMEEMACMDKREREADAAEPNGDAKAAKTDN